MGHKTNLMIKQSKFWGETQCLYCGPHSETHFISAKKGGYSSVHCHVHKWNRFFVISGKLAVEISREKGIDRTIVSTGQCTDVPPGVDHRFVALEDSEAIEIYWVDELDPHDIERRNSGGLDENTISG